MDPSSVRQLRDCVWEIAPTGAMRVPVRLYASEGMLERAFADNAPEQARNVATLPGIQEASLAMPDMHWGYGFPIGGVAAFDEAEGVVSPGGVGYDINCGVRLMACPLSRPEVAGALRRLTEELFGAIPTGVGSSGAVSLSPAALKEAVRGGAVWAVRAGYGIEADVAQVEEGGCMREAAVEAVSDRAWTRGRDQLGTLGAGNHFLEVGYVDEIHDADVAGAFGLAPGQVTLMIHCGSRGFGHQVCDDFLALMGRASKRYRIELPDRQLACAPIQSPEGRQYLGAMNAAVNYAFANRQIIAHQARQAFAAVLGSAGQALRTVYEVAHNIAKFETHAVQGTPRRLCVHRKGATRALGPGHPDVPRPYRDWGQPVLIPGDMGTCSYVLVGTRTAMEDTFGSACHGAGRALSRNQAMRQAKGRDLFEELRREGILLQAHSPRTVAEEMPEAYKDVSEVVDACQRAGIARRVARIRPLAVIKG
ncbi:MAG: RtcB family protein [Lentisphaeria bacterium]|nr:RtcB family protein [Lentisphaeria bacterium]